MGNLAAVIPFNVLNYILGMSDVPVGCYVIASFLGMLPGTWLYEYLGSLATTAVGLTHAWRASATTAAWPPLGWAHTTVRDVLLRQLYRGVIVLNQTVLHLSVN